MTRHASIGRILAASPPRVGPFRLVRELGEGGFAPVFLAVEEYGGTELRTVALKLFALDDASAATGTSGAKQARSRILEEARALCRVEHPNVVRFFQIVEVEDAAVFGLAMEHVSGRALGERIEVEKKLSLDATLEVGRAIASALAAVHAVGLVHRDVKPWNVIETNGVYKLIDFGIATRTRANLPESAPVIVAGAKRGIGTAPLPSELVCETVGSERTVRASENTGTATDGVAGTMGYIDPACLARGEPADASSDLYALGAMLYECLTGRMPASEGEGESVSRLRMNIVMGLAQPPPLREIAPDVPEGVARLVDALLSPRRDHRPRRAEWVACEIERLRRVRRGVAHDLPAEGPFRGLEAFDERHRDLYFGRATDIASAVELLRSRGLVALVGPSGSGKSSLARAGVLPAIADGSLGAWPPRWSSAVMSPGSDPRAALARALAPVLGADTLPADPDELATTLAARVESESTGLVILVDALEELVTSARPDDREYLALFLAALSSRSMPGLRAVVTARRDLLDPLLAEPALGFALARSVQLVAPLTAPAWVDVVEERLAAYDHTLEEGGLAAELARELAATAEAMPLVEFALARLWEHRDRERRVISRASLARIGGVAGALAQHAEATLTSLERARAGAAPAARAILLALTTPHGTRATRTRAELAEEVPDASRDDVLAAFEKARLVVADEGRLALAHDVLITRWPRLATWVQEERRSRELARDVGEAAARWRAQPGADLLLRGRILRDARALAEERPLKVPEPSRAFIAASRRNELRSTAGVVALASSVFVGAAVLFALYMQSKRDIRDDQLRAREETAQAAYVTKTILQAQAISSSERQRHVEDLIRAKHTCEKELAKRAACQPDAAPTSP